MKKLIFFISLLILSSGNLLSQSGWFWQNPLPQGNDLYAIQFLNLNTGYVIGNAGCILKTSNSGMSWKDTFFVAGLNNNSVPLNVTTGWWLNPLKGFIISVDGVDSKILKTTDGNMSWEPVSDSYHQTMRVMFFLDTMNGWAFGGGYGPSSIVLRTTNSGDNWVSNTFNFEEIYGTFFVNIYTGWISSYYQPTFGSSYSKIYKTTNGGYNWTTQLILYGIQLTKPNFINVNTGFIAGSVAYKTTDSGVSWSSMNISANRFVFTNIQTGYALNENTVLKSSNQGLNWVDINGFGGYDINIIDNDVHVVGQQGKIRKSTDLGNTWVSYSSNFSTSILWDVEFVDVNTGYVISRNSIYRTTNSGANWSLNSFFSGSIINDIYFYDSNIGFIIGENGFVRKTTNAGSNWNTVNLGSNETLFKTFFLNENTGWIMGPAQIYKTINAGQNWNVYIISPNYFGNKFLCFLNENYGIAAGSGGIGGVIHTTNSGINWIVDYSDNLYDFSKDSSNNLYVLRYNSIYKSTNLGQSWELINNSIGSINNIEMISSGIGFAYGLNGLIKKTTDGGFTWDREYNKTTNQIRSMFILDNNIAWAVGDAGTILKTTDGGGNILSSTPSILFQTPQSLSLHQNYPNPFNPVTKIKFDIPEKSNAKIIIYDLLGREITTLVNELLKPGSYSVDWDGTGFASGVYFYSLVTDDPSTGSRRGYVETKRMILVK